MAPETDRMLLPTEVAAWLRIQDFLPVPRTSESFPLRVFSYVEVTVGCWLWRGTLDGAGYGVIGRGRRGSGNMPAHRAVWELLVGPIPDGMEYDHLCRIHACVNPDDAEIVTPEENKRRGYGIARLHAMRTHCPDGHPFDGVLGRRGGKQRRRYCKTCARQRQAMRYIPHPRDPATHCQRGHPFTPENSYTPPGGSRECRACKADRQRAARAEQRRARRLVLADGRVGDLHG
jgi:hypothetical protein